MGTLTLVTFPIPAGVRAWIEDVADEASRGHGVGAALTREAVRVAYATGARTVDLTSGPLPVTSVHPTFLVRVDEADSAFLLGDREHDGPVRVVHGPVPVEDVGEICAQCLVVGNIELEAVVDASHADAATLQPAGHRLVAGEPRVLDPFANVA